MGRRTVTSRVHGPPGGRRRSAFYAVCGVLSLLAGAGALVLSTATRPDLGHRQIVHMPVVIDVNASSLQPTSVTVDVNPAARYDLYLTVDTTNTAPGDYIGFNVEGYRGPESRFITYTFTTIGDGVVRHRRDDATGARLETYELAGSVQIHHRPGEVELSFTPDSCWIASAMPVHGTVDIVEISPWDQALLVASSGLQVMAFPLAFAGLFLLWLALMRQLRLIGIQVAPPGRFTLPADFSMRRDEARAAAPRAAPDAGGAP